MNEPFLRALLSSPWIARAMISLPVPGSPVMRIGDSVAIAFSAWQRTPAPATGPVAVVPTAAAVQVSTLTPEQIDQRVQEAVTKAVAQVAARYAEENRTQLAEYRQTADDARKQLILASAELDKTQLRKQVARTSAMVRSEETVEAK